MTRIKGTFLITRALNTIAVLHLLFVKLCSFAPSVVFPRNLPKWGSGLVPRSVQSPDTLYFSPKRMDSLAVRMSEPMFCVAENN